MKFSILILAILTLNFLALGQANPNPVQEFQSGKVRKYSTAKHPKAKGLTFDVKVPESWTNREGDRPNVIQVFKGSAPYDNAQLMLMVLDAFDRRGIKPTKKEIDAMFSLNGLKELVPPEHKFIEGKRIVLDGEPGGMTVSDVVLERLDFKLHFRSIAFWVLYKDQFILLQFMVGGPENQQAEIIRKFNTMRPLFMHIANSLVISNKYQQPIRRGK